MRRIFSICAALLLAGPSWAQSAPVQQQNSNAVWFENWGDLSNATLRVTFPSGELEDLFAASGTPVFRLPPPPVADGVYSYELRAATSETRPIVNQLNNGRGDAARESETVPFVMNGAFVVTRGIITIQEELQEE